MDTGFYIYGDYIKAPTKVLILDPCPFGQPIILTVAHMTTSVEDSAGLPAKLATIAAADPATKLAF